ncbi:MAG: tRNA (adenosine(37)-N6)-dimethylallyltransferase MiaA [Thermoflexales bacterium]|nr:tRNA (adenosine(37)-N6)-dimethylallyltransferase MiaA [Thermoflexales bacterium]MDW8350354.1 tRNA (adenosine(37)-N6)-dimethylallyltransferase MiaA [Anaerolineae bacterium]
MTSAAPKLIAVIGPTAAGKSAYAIPLASQVDGEIVSADSRHIYRRMDIGTNKPTPDEQRRVRHHVIDLRDADERFSLGEYVQLAEAAIADILARGKTPLLVGGTGQYVRALLRGWQVPPVPPHDATREKWQRYAREHGQAALFAELAARDPDAARTIDPRNVRRVVRALEVMEVSGRRWSELQRSAPPAWRAELIYLNPPREWLYAQADARLMRMIEQGWLAETEALLDFLGQRGWDADAALRLPSMSALGYREMALVVMGRMTLDQAITEIKRATRRFIRAQDVWFRQEVAHAASVGGAVRVLRSASSYET